MDLRVFSERLDSRTGTVVWREHFYGRVDLSRRLNRVIPQQLGA
jgi:hypothetical protein